MDVEEEHSSNPIQYKEKEKGTLIDRGHIFHQPRIPPLHSLPNIPPHKNKITKDFDWDLGDDYPQDHNIFPTHPPLPTHPPALTNKPWWVSSRTTTKLPFFMTKPTTTIRPTTTKPTSRRKPWWETSTTRPTSRYTTKSPRLPWWQQTDRSQTWQQWTTKIQTTSTRAPTTTTTKRHPTIGMFVASKLTEKKSK